ncbi:MAG: ATP phosphoribosyltransferase [Candidatus Hydrothermarchaeota archaeon]|nr:ATP phosphoribosyltransferase [Candidatus Hydrothermarchaeota archaeon]
MLRLALPKGSLEEQTLRLFKEADLAVIRGFRDYNPSIDDPRITQVKILRPQEIPKYVEEGYFDLGISGWDWVNESEADVEVIADLPYSKQSSGVVRLVVAVTEDSDIKKPEEIKPGSRVTTEFPNLTKKYFEDLGIPVEIYFSYGASEAKVPELMDVVIDLTETGSTLRKNRLRIIGTILESTTKLLANKQSLKDLEKKKVIEEIKTLLLGVIEARGKVLLSMNVPEAKLEDLIGILPAMKKPTVSHLFNNQSNSTEYYAVETVVPKKEVNVLIPKLKEKGAEDILEMNISKIVK